MEKIVFKSTSDKSRFDNLTWKKRWQGEDNGLIACWEQGRKIAITNETLVTKVKNNELPVLPWKGGYENPIEKTRWHVPFYYYAMWLGLKGEDLKINLDDNIKVTCSRTKMTSIFTNKEELIDR